MHEGDSFFSAFEAAIPSFCLSHAKYTPVWEISCPTLQGSQPSSTPANKHFCRLFSWSCHLLPPPEKRQGHNVALRLSLCMSGRLSSWIVGTVGCVSQHCMFLPLSERLN